MVRQNDGSILATGANPATQTYEVEFTVGDQATQAIRLEALTHESHVSQSTGRGSNGNFVLSEIKVDAAPAGAPDSDLKAVRITAADANYEQDKYPITAAFDGKEGKTGWAVDGNTRFENSSAVFTFGEAIAPGSRVRVRLIHTWGGSHTIGRFRFSIPADGAAPVPAAIRETLTQVAAKRSESDRTTLNRYLAERFGAAGFAEAGAELRGIEAKLATAKAAIPETMILTEMPEPRTTHVLMRGEYDKPIAERSVQPDVPAALGGLPDDLPRNRLGLANGWWRTTIR